MRIENGDFRVTEINPVIPEITVNGGKARLRAVMSSSAKIYSAWMSTEEFGQLRDAINAAWDRMSGAETPETAAVREPLGPRTIKDRAGDRWRRVDDVEHEGRYILIGKYHFSVPCPRRCGWKLADIEREYGPIEVIEP